MKRFNTLSEMKDFFFDTVTGNVRPVHLRGNSLVLSRDEAMWYYEIIKHPPYLFIDLKFMGYNIFIED